MPETQEQVRSAPPPGPKRSGRPSARQITGLPDYTTVPLYPVSLRGAKALVNPLGMAIGYQAARDAIISWAPVRLPTIRDGRLAACVEYTDITGKPPAQPVAASLHWLWVDKNGKAHESVTRPLIVNDPTDYPNGEAVFRFRIAAEQVDFRTAFTSALKVTLMGAEPVLIRSAWLELGEV